jgi:hypothetical protein
MELSELKNYTARALELEAAIYTEEHLMEQHLIIIEDQQPTPPEEKKVFNIPAPVLTERRKKLGILIFGFAYCLFIIIIDLFLLYETFTGIPEFLMIDVFAIGLTIWFVRLVVNARKNGYETAEEYDIRVQRHKIELDWWTANKSRFDSEEATRYINAQNLYESQKDQYLEEKAATTNKHDEALSALKNALEDHYAKNVLFPKYRSFVAVSAINEYLQSGRCDKLEGADGAYNLYEMELRQNIVIGHLSTIIDNLEQIRDNQYSLYQELLRANQTIDDITFELRELKQQTKLNTYFSYVAAQAATSPTYIQGYIS